MKPELPVLEKISELGDRKQKGTVELAEKIDLLAGKVGISSLSEAVKYLDYYYRLQASAIIQGRITPDGQAQVEFDDELQASRMLISVAAFNLGLAVRPGFEIKLGTVIEPGGYFGMGDIIEDRKAILNRKLDPRVHLDYALTFLQTSLPLFGNK